MREAQEIISHLGNQISELLSRISSFVCTKITPSTSQLVMLAFIIFTSTSVYPSKTLSFFLRVVYLRIESSYTRRMTNLFACPSSYLLSSTVYHPAFLPIDISGGRICCTQKLSNQRLKSVFERKKSDLKRTNSENGLTKNCLNLRQILP